MKYRLNFEKIMNLWFVIYFLIYVYLVYKYLWDMYNMLSIVLCIFRKNINLKIFF